MHSAVCHDDEEDPLGILGGLSCRKRSTDDSPPTLAPDVAWGVVAPAKVDCTTGDPREVIDVILRMSKEARDRVSSRQVSNVRTTKIAGTACDRLYSSQFVLSL